MKLEFGPRYSVVHDSSTRGVDWSRNAFHNLLERTVATGSGLLSVSTGDQQARQRWEPSVPSLAASHRSEELVYALPLVPDTVFPLSLAAPDDEVILVAPGDGELPPAAIVDVIEVRPD